MTVSFEKSLHIYGKGKPLVFFHGWGFDAQIWLPLVPLLSDHYQLYLVDLPGFGLTPPMTWDEFKLELLTHLPSTFALIGWSMGGLFATRLAIEEPDRVSHLIMVASSPCFIGNNDWPGVGLNLFKTFFQNLVLNPQQTLQDFMTLQLQGQNVQLGRAPSLPGLLSGLNILMSWDLRQDVSLLQMPVSYMFGRFDSIVPRTTMETMQASFPHFQYTLFPKAAHVPFLSHPTEFITAINGVIL